MKCLKKKIHSQTSITLWGHVSFSVPRRRRCEVEQFMGKRKKTTREWNRIRLRVVFFKYLIHDHMIRGARHSCLRFLLSSHNPLSLQLQYHAPIALLNRRDLCDFTVVCFVLDFNKIKNPIIKTNIINVNILYSSLTQNASYFRFDLRTTLPECDLNNTNSVW